MTNPDNTPDTKQEALNTPSEQPVSTQSKSAPSNTCCDKPLPCGTCCNKAVSYSSQGESSFCLFRSTGQLISGALIGVALYVAAGMISIFSGFDFYIPSCLQPDPWIFGMMWGVIYVSFGISFTLLIDRITTSGLCGGDDKKRAIIVLYILNGVLNMLWIIAFNWRYDIRLALVIILHLLALTWFKIIATWADGYRFSSILLMPYGVWLILATTLNINMIYDNVDNMNRQVLRPKAVRDNPMTFAEYVSNKAKKSLI